MKTLIAILCTALLAGCTTSPLGRRQLMIVSDAQMNEMGVAAFRQIRTQSNESADASVNAYVRCVSDAVTGALDSISSRTGWEVVVFRDDDANAFALPGKKIGVFTGLLDVAENQDQLATVIAHEVAHVLAKHSNERVSTHYATQAGLGLIGTAGGVSNEVIGLLGAGAQYGVLLPFGRSQENEADLVGLDLMARAGFDPRASVALWRNMAASRKGGAPPEFLSTHPADERRIASLSARMPEATAVYERARSFGRRPACR